MASAERRPWKLARPSFARGLLRLRHEARAEPQEDALEEVAGGGHLELPPAHRLRLKREGRTIQTSAHRRDKLVPNTAPMAPPAIQI